MKEIPLWLKHPGVAIDALLEGNTVFQKFLKQEGQVKVLVYPEQDGGISESGQWIPSMGVEIEGSWIFNMYKDQYSNRIIEIPTTCFQLGRNSSGPFLQIDMTKVQPYFNKENNRWEVILLQSQKG